jgi:choline monooxygenase
MHNECLSVEAIRSEYARLAKLPDSAAVGLPPAAYGSDEVFDLEVARIFEREWVPLGRVEEVAEPGDYFTTEVAGDPLLVVRGDDGEVRVLSNVCRHKWTEVAEGSGNARVFVCPYHAWTYARDGQLVGARFMERTVGFNIESCRLPKLNSEIWGGFVFVNLDANAAPLRTKLAALEPIVGNYHMQDMRRFTGDDEIWGTNWKLLVENFTEGYHTFQTHKDSLQNVTPAELTYWGHDNDAFSAFYSPLAADEPAREPYHADLSERERRTVLMVCLYPSLVIALSPERVFYMCIIPVSAGTVRTRWGVASYGEDFENHTLEHIAKFYKMVNDEDQVRLESIQRGVKARYAGRGRLSWLETTNAHFGRYVARMLA